MQLKDIFSASSDGVSQPSNSSLRFKQKALAATILATLAIIAFIAVEASDTKPARKAPTEAAMITLRPDGTDKDVLIARYDANFLALSRRIEEVQREAAATETRLRAIIADQKSRLETQTSEVKDLKAIAGRAGLTPRPGETPEETEARIKSLLKANDDAAYISKLSSQFGSKTPGKVFHTDPARNTNEPGSSIVPALPDISGGVKVPDEAHAAARQAVSGPRLAMVTLPPPAPPTPPAPRVGPSPTLNPDTPLQVNRAAGTTVEDYLPAGSFVRGRLLTGVYASTGAGAASQPLPMVIRLEDTAVLPNAWRSQVTACHVTASATGDLSSERARPALLRRQEGRSTRRARLRLRRGRGRQGGRERKARDPIGSGHCLCALRRPALGAGRIDHPLFRGGDDVDHGHAEQAIQERLDVRHRRRPLRLHGPHHRLLPETRRPHLPRA